ncbi:MAG: NAD(P)/FAD-dependent oxidoreductase [Limisphaerales bacterium]
MNREFDLAIVGSGFGGSLLAMVARRLGRTVALLERGTHPRFVIGESSTPLANLLLEELADAYGLPRLKPLVKWGAWRAAYPDLPVGLKRGFTFFHHRLGEAFTDDTTRGRQLLVAASPHDGIADTHWYRPAFDHFLVREAEALGVEYRDRCEVMEVKVSPAGAALTCRRDGREEMLQARFVADAGNNPRGVLARSLGLAERPAPTMPATQALYAHFHGVRRLDALPITPAIASAPYPADDAAVHHCFPGGWIWVLRFDHGITSAGVAAEDALARKLNLAEGAPAWARLLARLPTVRAQFAGAEPVTPFVHAPRLTFGVGPAAGPGWALLPSAAGFVDPMMSTGFTLTLLGIHRLARAFQEAWGTPALAAHLATYADDTRADWAAVERLLGALYASLGDPAAFNEVARLYFAAVIYGETARRLGRPEVAGGLLLRSHPEFGPALKELGLLALHRQESSGLDRSRHAAALGAGVAALLARCDLGGLADLDRRNWHPVLAADLLDHRGRIGATEAECRALLARAGFVG